MKSNASARAGYRAEPGTSTIAVGRRLLVFARRHLQHCALGGRCTSPGRRPSCSALPGASAVRHAYGHRVAGEDSSHVRGCAARFPANERPYHVAVGGGHGAGAAVAACPCLHAAHVLAAVQFSLSFRCAADLLPHRPKCGHFGLPQCDGLGCRKTVSDGVGVNSWSGQDLLVLAQVKEIPCRNPR